MPLCNKKYLKIGGTRFMEPKLLDQLRDKIRLKHYSIRTEKAYIDWNRRFILFHNKKHPKDMGRGEVEQFLTFLAVKRKVASSTQNQALSAILFMYKEVLGIELPWLKDVTRAKKPEKVPIVLSTREVRNVFANLDGIYWIMGNILYGAGLRLMECIRLRVKDIDFDYQQITVRDGKGQKDRVTMLPETIETPLRRQMEKVKIIFNTIWLKAMVKSTSLMH
jgi:integrase